MDSERVKGRLNSCFVLKCSEVGLRHVFKAYPPPYRTTDNSTTGLNRNLVQVGDDLQ